LGTSKIPPEMNNLFCGGFQLILNVLKHMRGQCMVLRFEISSFKFSDQFTIRGSTESKQLKLKPSPPYALLHELFLGLPGPASIGGGAGGAGVQDAADVDIRLPKHFARFFLCKSADGHNPLWL